MESIYTELALYESKGSVLGLIMLFPPYMRSAMVLFPLLTDPPHANSTGSLYIDWIAQLVKDPSRAISTGSLYIKGIA